MHCGVGGYCAQRRGRHSARALRQTPEDVNFHMMVEGSVYHGSVVSLLTRSISSSRYPDSNIKAPDFPHLHPSKEFSNIPHFSESGFFTSFVFHESIIEGELRWNGYGLVLLKMAHYIILLPLGGVIE